MPNDTNVTLMKIRGLGNTLGMAPFYIHMNTAEITYFVP